MQDLGKVEDVRLRQIWEHESLHFTPWLAENLDLVGDVIGLSLELEGCEVQVDRFSADIIARDIADDSKVLIENQLEGSDHKHLGQIMTYLSGLDAKTIVWIARHFEDAHLSAIKWLNNNTDPAFSFFAIRMRTIRIGDSSPAPLPEVLARPNGWDRRVSRASHQVLSNQGQMRRAFWTHYAQRHPDDWSDMTPPASPSVHWYDTDWKIIQVLFLSSSGVGVFLRGHRGEDDHQTNQLLTEHSESLSDLLGVAYQRSARQQYFMSKLQIDTSNPESWDAMSDWLNSTAAHYWNTVDAIDGLHE